MTYRYTALVLLPLAAAGCRSSQPARGSLPAAPAPVVRGATVPVAAASPVLVRSPLSDEDLEALQPNELGRIPVVMYHAIGATSSGRTRYDRMGLNIRPETFRKHLRLMYEAGWHPVNMRDAISARMDVPAGKTPVVLTFDDGRGTQFRYLPDGSIDPNCAVGILEEFHREHPDWPLRGSFYVMPRSRYNPTPFEQPGLDDEKFNYLLDRGFEIANHSTTHRMMKRLDADELAWEMAQCVRYVKKLAPDATMDTMALPGGSVPRSEKLLNLLLAGHDGKTGYRNLCVLRAWGGATLPPAHRLFDRRNVLRIGCSPGFVEKWIKLLARGETPRYVSDGDPDTVTVPARMGRWVSKPRTTGLNVFHYEDRIGKKTRIAAAGEPARAESQQADSDQSLRRTP